MSLRAHYDALAAMVPAKYTVHQWVVPDLPTYPYVVLWGGIGSEDTEALSGDPDTLTLRPKITYAAQTGAQLLMMVDAVRAALNNRTPVVAGWSPSRLKQSSLIDAAPDYAVTIPNTKTHPVFCVDEFPFTSQRA
jgi:hypothetical protein